MMAASTIVEAHHHHTQILPFKKMVRGTIALT
jgi:hypothetical protein